MTIDELKSNINTFTTDELSDAYKKALRDMSVYKTDSNEFKELSKASDILLKEIRSRRKKPDIPKD